jgi:hypothetical protein
MRPSAAGIDPSTVIAGLDPAIHPFNEMLFLMDARVISAFTRVHSPSKTGVNALNDALCPGMTSQRLRPRR